MGPRRLGVYNGLQIPWSQVGASHQAVYAAVAGPGREGSRSARAGEDDPVDQNLRPEEEELVKPWQ